MTNATDAMRALDPSYWEVEVRVSGVRVLTIGSDHLAGISNIEDYADTVRKCGEHLRSFIGTPAGSASGEDAKDAARYRWLRMQGWFSGSLCVLRDPKKVLTSGAALGADCPSRERLDAAIDAAMGSANGQG